MSELPVETIFISYSHKDRKYKDEMETSFRQLNLTDIVSVETWTDTNIIAGQDWRQEIDKALTRAAVAVLVITKYFLTSQFIKTEEVPFILKRRKGGLDVFPIIARWCVWENEPWLKGIQVRPNGGKPVWRKGGEPDLTLREITLEIAQLLKYREKISLLQKTPTLSEQDKSLAIFSLIAERALVVQKLQQYQSEISTLETRTGSDPYRLNVIQHKMESDIREIVTDVKAMRSQPLSNDSVLETFRSQLDRYTDGGVLWATLENACSHIVGNSGNLDIRTRIPELAKISPISIGNIRSHSF